jgi:hypothetical protein
VKLMLCLYIWNKTIKKWNVITKLYRFEIDHKFSHVKFISLWKHIEFEFMAQMKILDFLILWNE